MPPAESFVVEDAVNGVQAAKAGNMVALGLARADDEELLADARTRTSSSRAWTTSPSTALAEGRLERNP